MNVVRWDTPASDVKSLRMISLVDDGQLAVVVEGSQHSERERFRFLFTNFFGYRNLLEEYRTTLWQSVEAMPNLGWTRRIVNSTWINELRQDEPLFLLHGGEQAMHYLLCTEDAVIEVLTKVVPEIRKE